MHATGISHGADACQGVVGYANRIADVIGKTLVTSGKKYLNRQDALNDMKEVFKKCHGDGGKVIFLGNGGSSAIASHIAIDFTKNVGIRSISLNDFPTLTCLSNDFGYEKVFAKQIEFYAKKEDCVVCISTGGKSRNIIEAVTAARNVGCRNVYTFSGMFEDNILRNMGDVNFYTPSFDYGIVEISHFTILHSLCPCTI